MAFSHWRLRVAAVDRRTDGHTRTHTDSNNPRCACVQVRVNKWLDLDDEIGSEVLPLFTLHGDVPQPPIVVELRVEDDGAGFNATNRAGMGSGISGMRERVIQLDGSFEVTSEPSRGTTVLARIPLAEKVTETRSVNGERVD